MLRDYKVGIDDVLDELWAEAASNECRLSENTDEVERLLNGILKVDQTWNRTAVLRFWAEAVGKLAVKKIGAGHRYSSNDRIESSP